MVDQSDFAILRHVNKTPALASCAKCHRKFFTPNTFYSNPYGAEEYLRGKFDLHDCLGQHGKTTRVQASDKVW
jgi:hypothetical protein